MRYFKLENSASPTPEELDITTTEVLFHDISGLGFDEETDFASVGSVWRLNSVSYAQKAISGKVCFTDRKGTTPYRKYTNFKTFIDKPPLTLVYYPEGLDGISYRKKVRVTKLEKTELDKYGVLDCGIDFTPYTPWYEIITAKNGGEIVENDTGWVWGDNGENPPLVFEPAAGTNAIPTKFRNEARAPVDLYSSADNDSPVKITIHGPVVNPSWSHYVDDRLIASGGFDANSPLSINANERLVIDNTEGEYAMTVFSDFVAPRNVYSLRDFDLQCFFTLQKGKNTVIVSSPNTDAIKVEVEGHIHYATV